MADDGTYIKMSDRLPEHRKIAAVGGDAGWLYICGLGYASRNLSDGHIPKALVARLSDRKQPAKLAAKLIDVELWHEAGHACKRCPQPPSDEYVIHDYLEHQRSSEQVAEIKAKRAAAGKRGGNKKASNAKQKPSKLLGTGYASAQANGTPDTEEVLRTSQTEEPLRGSQTEIPPSAGADEPRRAVNPGDVVKSYVDGAKAGRQPRPAESLRKRVGKQAGSLLADKQITADQVLTAAYNMGAGGWADLAVQLQRDAANGKPNGAQRQTPQQAKGIGALAGLDHIDYDAMEDE